MIPKIKTRYGDMDVDITLYKTGGTAVILTQDGQRFATLSVNFPFPEVELEEGEFAVKTWSENEQVAADCLASGLFIDTGKRIKSGYVEASVWRFK
jgi:hypothetical protein